MVTWRLKSCPRCGGDIFVHPDVDGWIEQCLQCSLRRELPGVSRQKPTANKTGTKEYAR